MVFFDCAKKCNKLLKTNIFSLKMIKEIIFFVLYFRAKLKIYFYNSKKRLICL